MNCANCGHREYYHIGFESRPRCNYGSCECVNFTNPSPKEGPLTIRLPRCRNHGVLMFRESSNLFGSFWACAEGNCGLRDLEWVESLCKPKEKDDEQKRTP